MNLVRQADLTASPPARILAWLARRPRLALAVLCLALWTPGMLTLPPLDRDESRFAQASKQMLETGNLIDIRFGAVPRYKKPAGIYWLQAAATEAAGWGARDHIWTYRIPSLFGALAAVWLAFWCARPFLGAEGSLIAATLLGTCLLTAAEASIATTDAVLLACVLGVQGVLFRAYLAAKAHAPQLGWGLILAGWAAFGAGILVKGPVVAAVCALTAIGVSIWDRDGRWLRGVRPLAGLGVVVLMVAPWAVAIAIASHGHFFEQSLGQDFGSKLTGGRESHGAPPGYFLALTTLTFWPAVLFLLPSLAAAIRARSQPAIRFLLVWAGACWIMFEAVPTKLPHYILPVYPALAILAAAWLSAPRKMEARWERVLFYVAAAQFVLGFGALAAAPVLLPDLYGEGVVWWLTLPAVVFLALSVGALLAQLRHAPLSAAALCVGAALVVYPLLTLGVAPNLGQLWVSSRAAAVVRASSRPGDPPPALAGYEEPSLVFLLGTDTRLTDGQGAAAAGAAQGGLALVDDEENKSFLDGLAELQAAAAEVSSVSGFNYSRGRRVHIRIYRVSPVSDEPPPPPE